MQVPNDYTSMLLEQITIFCQINVMDAEENNKALNIPDFNEFTTYSSFVPSL